MNSSLYISKTGLQAQDLNLQYISNNIANASSTAYKASKAEFGALMTQMVREASPSDGSATGGLQVGTGVKAVGSITDFSQGEAVQTNRELDVMIQGEGYFKVLNDDGEEFYTRKGSFIVNEDGNLATLDNYVLSPQISIPSEATSITFNSDGIVTVTTPDNTSGEDIGQIELYRFVNQNGLKSLDSSLYGKTETSGDEISGFPNESSFGSLSQNYLEGSNVDTVTEMVNMITAQRSYELASKTLNTSNEMLEALNNVV